MEAKNTTTLTDEQIEEISTAIEEASADSTTAEATKLAEKMKEEAGDLTLEEQSANVIINPVTGKPMAVENMEDDEDELQSFEDMLKDDRIQVDDIDMSKVKINSDTAKTITETMFPQSKLSIDDYNQIIAACDRVKQGEKFSYFKALPESLQSEILNIIGPEMASNMGSFSKQGKNYVAKSLLKEIISAETMNVTVYDLQKNMASIVKAGAKEMKEDSYWSNVRVYFQKGILEKAEEYRLAGDIEKAELCEKIHESYEESYTFKNMRHLFETTGKLRVKKIQIEKFKRTCADFNFKYQKSQNLIQEISLVLTALDRHVDKKIDIDIIKEFICIFIAYTDYMHMDPNNIVDHTFMYYFIYNIITLDNCKEDEESVQFRDQLINNINEFLWVIVDKKQK